MTALTIGDNGKNIAVKSGDIIQMELEEKGATGYLWELDELDNKYFEVIKIETRSIAKEGITGAPVTKVWQLKTKQPGKTTLKMFYYRPWEGKQKAVDAFNIKVEIF